jgi:hypothetical protein
MYSILTDGRSSFILSEEPEGQATYIRYLRGAREPSPTGASGSNTPPVGEHYIQKILEHIPPVGERISKTDHYSIIVPLILAQSSLGPTSNRLWRQLGHLARTLATLALALAFSSGI